MFVCVDVAVSNFCCCSKCVFGAVCGCYCCWCLRFLLLLLGFVVAAVAVVVVL